LSAAFRLAAGFGLAALLLIFFEALLAVFPNPIWTALLLVPVVGVAGLAIDTARRRRAWARPPRAAASPEPRATGRRPDPRPPDVRPASPDENAIAAALGRFNDSSFPRTVAGISKALGTPQASAVPLAESPGTVALTIGWELSWYRYRIDPAAHQPVALDARGEELSELDERFTAWNVTVGSDGRVATEPDRTPSPGS
jgi:hypothetical protein